MILIALGANLAHPDLGPPPAVFDDALTRLADAGIAVTARSRLYRNPAVGPTAQPDYVNAAVAAGGGGDPRHILARLLAVEAGLGRVRRERWGPRVLDLDLIGVDDLVRPSPAAWPGADGELVLPHPRAHTRAFVLAPIADVAPNWRHPVLGRTAAQLRDALPGPQLAALQSRAWPV